MAQAAMKDEGIDVRGEIDAAIRRGAADPALIARKLVPKLSAEQLTRFAFEGLVDLAQRIMSDIRTGPMVTREATTKDGPFIYALDTTRFAMASANVPDSGYLKYRRLTYEQCIKIAEANEALAAGNLRSAKQMRALADAIKQHGVNTAGELPDAVLVEVFK